MICIAVAHSVPYFEPFLKYPPQPSDGFTPAFEQKSPVIPAYPIFRIGLRVTKNLESHVAFLELFRGVDDRFTQLYFKLHLIERPIMIFLVAGQEDVRNCPPDAPLRVKDRQGRTTGPAYCQ